MKKGKGMFIALMCLAVFSLSAAEETVPTYSNTVIEDNAKAAIVPTLDLSSYSYVRVGFYKDKDLKEIEDFLSLGLVADENDDIIGQGQLFVYYDIIASEALDVKLLADGPMKAGESNLDWYVYRDNADTLVTGGADYEAGIVGSKNSNETHKTDTVGLLIETTEVTAADTFESKLYVYIESRGAGA